MTNLTDKQIFDAIRLRKKSPLTKDDVNNINAIMYSQKLSASLPWINAANLKLGEKEIPGPKHNNWIAAGWARLGAPWFNDDETPWCGFFVAWALKEAGLTYPKNFASAASFKNYGIACHEQFGAIGVKSRLGGNHVFFIVGETPDKFYYKALGGNQSNAVNIMDVLKSSVTHIRWPSNTALIATGLPIFPHRKIIGNQA